jgi:magnesium transporter
LRRLTVKGSGQNQAARITGFFGQNFAWLIRHISSYTAFIIYGLGGLVVPLALLFLWLRLRTLHTNTATPAHGN